MARNVRIGLIQATCTHSGDADPKVIKQAMIEKHIGYIEEAAKRGAQIVCLQELFFGPYFAADRR